MMLAVLRDRQAWLHSAKSFLAAMLALYVALAFALPRPYWAMATSYIVMQSALGGTRSRGLYRIAGTFIAAVATVLMLPNLVQTPLLLALAFSLWLALCAFLSQLKRGPSSYVFMLAGYTVAIIGFPAIAQPETIFDAAVSRSEEITVGALSAILVAAVVFPTSIKPMVHRRVDDLLRDTAAWCAQVLADKGSPAALRKRMAGDLLQLDAIIPFAKRDDPRNGALDEWLRELRARLLGLLPVLASVEDRLRRIGATLGADDPLRALIGELRDWVQRNDVPTLQAADAYRARIAALRTQLGSDDTSLLRDTLLLRLGEMVELWYDGRQLQASIHDGAAPPDAIFALDLRHLSRFDNFHYDWGMMVFAALAAGATLFGYCAVAITIGWPGAVNGAAMVAVSAAFFAAQDDPAPSMRSFLVWMSVSILCAGVYLFGIGPYIQDFAMLALVLTPYFLLLGLLVTQPKYTSACTLLMVNLCSLLSIDNINRADFGNFVNSSLATFLGMLFALVMTRVFRSVGAEWTARRLVRQGWGLLAEAAEGHGQQDRDRFLVRMLDLLGLLAPRISALPAESEIAAVDMLDEARMGLNILNLRRARNGLPAVNREHVNDLLAAIAAHYRARQHSGHALPPPTELRSALDASLERLRAIPHGTARDEALIGLVGLRYGLYPRGPQAQREPHAPLPA